MKERAIPYRIIPCILLMLLSCVLPVEGTQTKIWNMSTSEEFQQGELEQVVLTQTGEVTLAPMVEKLLPLEEKDLMVWAMAEDSKGNVYVGTGEQGRIFKITPTGKRELFFDSPELAILSLTIDADDTVYAGTAPDGLIYQITAEGSPSTFFVTEEHYVWSLVFGPDRTLYAGTGEGGKIFAIAPDGSGKVLYDSPESHIMTMLYAPQGALYAGTEGNGLTYKITPDGKAFVLYQAKEEEVHALAHDSQGNLYLAALTNSVSPQPQVPSPNEQQARPKEKSLKRSSMYKITPEGHVSRLLELPETLIYAIVLDEQDRLLVGTDAQGMLYQVSPDGTYRQMLGIQDANILALLRTSTGTLYVGTGDTGSVYRLSAQLAEEGQYLSIVHDVGTTATWGTIFWRGTASQLALFTRTGNTSTPDETWSQWSPKLQNQEGEPIPNPSARFIQWKAVFTPENNQSAVLEEVSAAYLPQNLAPIFGQVATFHETEQAQQEQNNTPRSNGGGNSTPSGPASQEAGGKKNGIKPPQYIPPAYLAIVWEASDPNDEELVYAVELRAEEDSTWQLIEEKLDVPAYLLDTTTLPDGSYYAKVTASDSPANPPNQAREVQKISERFTIDNTAPQISIALNQTQDTEHTQVIVVAQDELSRLTYAAYALDAGEWISIFPDDKVTDSRGEKYSIALPSDLTPQTGHTLSFKAEDQFKNVGLGKIRFTIPKKQSASQE